MADQALFAYRVQLPDGSEAIRQGGADRAPTHGELADYAANQGERYLGPVAMSPDIPPAERPTPAESPVAPLEAPAPARTIATAARDTFLPSRSLLSEGPSIIGGTLAGGVTAAVAPPFAPLAAGAGSAVGEAARIGYERLTGAEPAEAGDVMERTQRAFLRGAAGEALAVPLRYGARYVARAVGPTARAAEELAPTLTRTVPADASVARLSGTGLADVAAEHVPVDTLLTNPAALAGTQLAPEAQQTMLARWWQQNAARGGQALGEAWDALGDVGQRVLAGDQHGAMATLVDAARGGGAKPLAELTMRDVATAGGPATLLWYTGHPHLAAAVGAGTLAAEKAMPWALRTPTGLGWFGALPQLAPLATPASWGLGFGTQVAASKALP